MKRTLCPQNAHLFIWTGEQVYKLLIDWLGFYSMLNTNVTREKESLLVLITGPLSFIRPPLIRQNCTERIHSHHKTTR